MPRIILGRTVFIEGPKLEARLTPAVGLGLALISDSELVTVAVISAEYGTGTPE